MIHVNKELSDTRMTWTTVYLLTLWLTAVSVATVSTSKCSKASREADMDECLLQLQGQMYNTSAFWFGNQYAVDCPQGENQGEILCVNPRDDKSIANRMFPVSGPDGHSLIDRFLEVNYITGSGTYSGCGHEVNAPSWESDIDPLSGSRITAWNTRLMPDLKFNSSDAQYFTIIFYDVGYMLPHAVYVNVEGNTITQDNTIKDYHGPQNPFPRSNAYMFLLYKQNTRITVSEQWKTIAKTNTYGGFLVANFAKDYNLEGPVAVNWMGVAGDLYTASLAEKQQWLYTCPLFVGEAIDRDDAMYTFMPRPASLSVSVDVTYTSTDLSFNLCCKDFKHEAQTAQISPLSNEVLETCALRTDSTRDIQLRKLGQYDTSSVFQGEMYALFLLDVSCDRCGSVDGYRIHNFIVNIRDNALATGTSVANYAFPDLDDNDSSDVAQRYFYLLYKQDGMLASRASDYRFNTRYVTRCTNNQDGLNRCHFKLENFVTNEKLVLVGANTFNVKYDEYAQYDRLTRLNNTELTKQFCQGNTAKFPNFEDPCPTATSSGLQQTGLLVSLACSVLLVVLFS